MRRLLRWDLGVVPVIIYHFNAVSVIQCNYMLWQDMIPIYQSIYKHKRRLKRFILLQTAAIFFLSNLYIKHGIGSDDVMVDFICKGYLELSGARVELELQNEKFLPTVGFEPGTLLCFYNIVWSMKERKGNTSDPILWQKPHTNRKLVNSK